MRILKLSILLAVLLGAIAPARAQSPQVRWLLLRQNPNAAVAGGAYTGPGDVAGWSSAYGYWGLRAYTAAGIGGSLVDIVDSGGANGLTIHSAANGFIDTAALTTWIGAHGTAFVNKIYDQINSQHLISAGATRPPLVLSMVGGLPAMFSDGGASPMYLTTSVAAAAQAQPLTVASIQRANTFVAGSIPFSDGTFNFDPLLVGGIASIAQNFGVFTNGYTGVADNTFGSLISVANNASSSMSVNGTITAVGGGVGTNGIAGTNKITMASGTDAGTTYFLGYIFEIIVQAGAVSPTNQSLLTANQRAIGTGF
jgi:hypothetical protein